MESVFDKAVEFALKAHFGQLRKDGNIYILHPLEVATIVGTMTNDTDVLSAAVLHDTVEDTNTTMQDILDNFGERIAALVASETENKRPFMNESDSWKIRKRESLEVLKNSDDIAIKMLWLGDKLSNMRAVARDFGTIGERVFERFNEKNPKEQRWYHKTVLDYTKELSDYYAYKEYNKLFHQVFDEYEEE